MQKILILLLLIHVQVSYGQNNYYTFNQSDSLYKENDVQVMYEKVLNNLPDKFILKPIIYHQIVKNDSIINYFRFEDQMSDSLSKRQNCVFEFKQDSLFLFLNKKLPEFKLEDLQGKDFSFSQLSGKPTLLNIWAIRCPPCVMEIPELNLLKERYGEKMNFIALTENTCKEDSLSKFIERHPFNFVILQNAEYYKKNILKISSIPRTLFIDKDGYIRYIQANFPYTAIDLKKGIKQYDLNNNYFVTIIEKLIKENSNKAVFSF